jgi:hypothetical protein
MVLKSLSVEGEDARVDAEVVLNFCPSSYSGLVSLIGLEGLQRQARQKYAISRIDTY